MNGFGAEITRRLNEEPVVWEVDEQTSVTETDNTANVLTY